MIETAFAPRIPAPERIASALERIALALEIITRETCGIEARPDLLTPDEEAAIEARDDSMTMLDEETMAVLETLEGRGPVPLSVYTRLGIDPPNRAEQQIDETAFDAPQPGAHPVDEEIRTYRRRFMTTKEEPTE